jgi:hypothetical protein
VTADLVDLENPWQHDPLKLAKALVDLYWRVSAQTTAD